MVQAKKCIYLFIQAYGVTVDKYIDKFKALVMVVETYGRTLFEPWMIEANLETMDVMKEDSKALVEVADRTNPNNAIKIMHENILVLMLLDGANHQRYICRGKEFNVKPVHSRH